MTLDVLELAVELRRAELAVHDADAWRLVEARYSDRYYERAETIFELRRMSVASRSERSTGGP